MTLDGAASSDAMACCLGIVGERVARWVSQSRVEGDVDDAQRGVYFPSSLIIRDALAPAATPQEAVIAADELPARLVGLGERVGLDDVDLAILLIACAVNIQPRFEHFFIVLNNEVDTRAPMVSTALRLAGCALDDPAARGRFREDAPLLRHGLVNCGPADRPLMTRLITVPERVVDFLLGDDRPDPVTESVTIPVPGREFLDLTLPALPLPALPAALRARAGSAGLLHAVRLAMLATGREPIVVGRMSQVPAQAELELPACQREAALTGRALVLDLRDADDLAWLQLGLRSVVQAGIPLLLVVRPRARLPQWRWDDVTLPLPTAAVRRGWWLGLGASLDEASAHEAVTHLDPEGIASVIRTGRAPVYEWPSAQVQRVEPAFDLSEVVTSDAVRGELRDLRDRVRTRSTVLDEWGMRPGGGRGRGVTALFTGAPGTGKTMAAEALAGELRVPLFRSTWRPLSTST